MTDAPDSQSGTDTLLTREDANRIVAEGARRYFQRICRNNLFQSFS
jgi:predicted NAD/FAD-binding protein